MGTRQSASPAGYLDGASGGEAAGRITVKERVLRKVAEAASAEAVGVARSDVSVSIGGYRGGLAVSLRTPFPIPDLDDSRGVAAAEPVVSKATRLQDELRDRLESLLGRDVSRVEIVIDGARLAERRRVL